MISRKISSCLVELIFTFALIVNVHTASFDFLNPIPLLNLILSSNLPFKWSFTGSGFSLSKEWLCCDIYAWRKLRKLKREKKAESGAKRDLWEPWPRNKTLRIGIQLQIIPAHISAVLRSFRVGRPSLKTLGTYHKVQTKTMNHAISCSCKSLTR